MAVRETTLESGIKVITDHFDAVETSTIGVWVGAGSALENEDNLGVAHFLEHMAFKGTKTRSALDIAREIESVGGYLNAFTSKEITAYHARVLKNDLPLALNILTDILQNPSFEEAEFERERGVILQEIGQTLDTPDDIIFDYFYEKAFEGQIFGRPILGTNQSVSKMETSHLRSFMGENYADGKIVVAASGNVDHDFIVGYVKDNFKSLSRTTPKYKNPTYRGGVSLFEKDLEQLHLIMGTEAVSYLDPDYYGAAVYSTLLGGGMSSRLFQEVREKRGLAYSIFSFISPYVHTGLFGIYVGTSPKDGDLAIEVIKDTLKQTNDSFANEEIERAKNQLKASIMMSMESPSGRANTLAKQILIMGKPLTSQEIIQKIEDVSRDNIKSFIERKLSLESTFIALGSLAQTSVKEDFSLL